jgi:hypothetical protein
MSNIPRKKFLSISLLGSAGFLIGRPVLGQDRPSKPPALQPELVKEFVGKSHNDLKRVKELLTLHPGLLNCSWDWGGGDFETGLEAAGHVGNKEIAEFLLDNGARMNLFCAAMLGKIEIVKATLSAFPALKSSKGPHGLQLIHHATKGAEGAKEVLQYLESIGAQ